MGKTPSPGKWIKSLLGKKSSKSSLEKGSQKLRSATKEEVVVKVKDNNNAPNLPIDPPPVLVSSQEVAATQTVPVPDVVIPEKVVRSSDIEGQVSGNGTEEVKLEEAATKVQSAFRAHQARGEFQTLKGITRLQAVVRGHLVRRQAVATYSCIWGIVKLQALARGKNARSSETGVQLQKTNTETENSETLQGSTYSWLGNPTKLSMIDKILVSSPTTLPLKIQYGPEDPNSAKVWLERWTQLQVWAPGPLVVKSRAPKSQTKKRNFQAVDSHKGKVKRGAIKKPSGGLNTGNSSTSRSTAETEKPKRTVRKASTLGKELSRVENDKSKQSSRKSTSTVKEGSSLEVKDEKPRVSLKKAPLSNGPEKPTRKSAEKKKDDTDSVQKELPGDKVSASDTDLVEKELPGDKVSASVIDTPEEEKVKDSPENVAKEADSPETVAKEADSPETVAKEADSPETVAKEVGLDKNEKLPVLDNPEQEELKTTERSEKAEQEIQVADVQISSENGYAASENTKPSDRRASLPAKIENHHQDDGVTHSGRKIPSYMAPTASAKARIRGQGSPRIAQEKPDKNGTTRRHSLPPAAANGKLSTMSPRAHRLLIASAKGSMNSDRSFSSSKDIGDKSTKAGWKR